MAALPKFVPEPEVRWRPLADGDLAYVAALEAQIHAAPWTMGNFRDSIAAGHYATETFGIRRLGEHLAERFGLRHVFLDVPNPI